MGRTLEQFQIYLTPPDAETPTLGKIDHHLIREFVGHLHEAGLEKSSIARKLAALRSFFKYCVREGLLKENPARLVPTPKLPKRIPAVLSAEEMSGFLDQLAVMQNPGAGRVGNKRGRAIAAAMPSNATLKLEDSLFLRRDRAILELLYAAGLRVSELTGLNIADVDQKDQMVRVIGKGRKERIVPYGAKAAEALKVYWTEREKLLRNDLRHQGEHQSRSRFFELHGKAADAAERGPHREEVRAAGEYQLGHAPALPAARLRHASAGRRCGSCARFRNCWDTSRSRRRKSIRMCPSGS